MLEKISGIPKVDCPSVVRNVYSQRVFVGGLGVHSHTKQRHQMYVVWPEHPLHGLEIRKRKMTVWIKGNIFLGLRRCTEFNQNLLGSSSKLACVLPVSA